MRRVRGAKRKGQSSLLIAVGLWYSLGIISISTSKVLLSPTQLEHGLEIAGVPPMLLTLQQLGLGSVFLWLLLQGKPLNSSGLIPWESLLTGQRIDTQSPTDIFRYENLLRFFQLFA